MKRNTEIRELSNKLNNAVRNKNLREVQEVAQEIFDAGYDIEEMKVSEIVKIQAQGNLINSGWLPRLIKREHLQ